MASHVSGWRRCPGDRLRKLPLPSRLLLPVPVPVAEWGTFRPLAASHSVCPVFGCSGAGISASHLTESTFMSSSQGPNRLGPCSACRM